MRRLLPFLHLVFATTFIFSQDLLLVGVFDLDIPSNAGKATAVQATADIPSLSAYGLESCNNGAESGGEPELTFPDVPLAAGEIMWFVRDAATIQTYFGDAAVNVNGDGGNSAAVNQNGDDAILLHYNSPDLGWTPIDAFGEVGVDGSGEVWEYVDSWAFRFCDSRTPSTTFDHTQWLIGLPNCAEDALTNAEALCHFPTANFTCSGSTVLSNIYTLQMPDGELGNESQTAGFSAEVSGHVTGVTSSGFYLQDGSDSYSQAANLYSAVYVYEGSAPTVLQGDEVTVAGTVSEYYSLTQLQDPTVTVVSSGNTLPGALLLSTGDVAGEGHESMLVNTTGTCDNADLGFGEWSLDDGTGPAVVDDQMYATVPVLGGNYTLTGPLNYSFSAYKVEPRSADDFVVLDEPDPCATLPDAQEPNNTLADATDATAGGSFSASLCPTDDLDMYMVTAVAGGVLSLTTQAVSGTNFSTDTYLTLYDASGAVLASNDDGGEGYLSFIEYTAVAAGNFYFEVSVSSWAAGDVFDYSAVVTNDGPAPIVPQNVTANAVGADIVVAWEPAPSLEEVSNAANTVDGAYAWKNKVSTIHPNKIALAESRLGPNNTNSRDAGDTCEEAIEAVAGDNSATGADQWFTYTATMTGSMNITSCLAGQLQDTRLTVYDACETLVQVAYNDDAYCSAITGGNSYASDVTFDIVAGETYKIFWDDYWSPAAFTWNLSESEPVDPCAGLVDVNEPNDTMADATDASAGGTFAAAICPAGESDMYMVNAVAGGTISLATAVATTPGIDTKVYLYDASGVQLGYNDDFGGLTSFVDLLVPADGIYYFEVVAYSASQVFDYSAIVVNDDPPLYIPTYSVLRDGVELVTGLETQTYTDAGVTVSVEYCYTVTQVLADATVSAPSDPACAMVMPGGTCDLAITATEGDDGNEATGDEQWFMYTTTLTGTLTATTCYAGQTEDTDVDVYTSCDAASPLASSDDAFCGDVTGGNNYASEVTIDVVAGETYYFFWDDTWNPGPFTWYLYETPPPTEPTGLVAQGGMGYAYLTWNGVEPLTGTQSSNFDFNQNEVQSQEQEYYNQKKANIATPAPANTTASFSIGDYSSSSSRDDHALDVTFLCDFGTWQEEVGWSIVDASGVVVASGIAPDEQTVTGLAEGTYTVYATDTFGDGWNGNTLFAYTAVAGSDTLTHLRWSLGTGGGLGDDGELVVVTGPDFMVSEELSDLTFSQFAYNPVTDAFDVTVTNTGLQNAWTVGMTLDLDVEGAGTCDAPPAWGQFGFPQVAPAQEIVLELPFVTNYFINNLNTGYGDFTVVAMIDAGCTEFEVDETNNVSETLVSLTDPFDGITWNVYRAEDGAEPSFNSVATLVDVQEYLDDNDGAGLPGGDYVYYVTQVAADGFESDSSNYADASVYGSEDFPPPVDLMGEADGFEVMLEWTAPDLTAWEPPSLTANYSPIPAGTKPYITPPAAPVSSSRQGGDTFESAVAIDVLPYENAGTTVGYTADYGPYDDAVNAGLLCEYTGWLGNTGAAADVVYSLSLTEPTNLQISACGSLYDTALGVFTTEDDGTGTMVPVLLAANDDFCDLQSEITCEFPAGDIYIVISGYSTSEGDYVLAVNNLDLESPVVGYGVYRDGEMVGMTDHVDSTSYDEFAYDPLTPEGAELEYVVTAMYGDFDIESPSAPVTVTTSLPEFVCAGPQNLTAEALSNNVELRWDAPEGGPTWFGHYNGTFNGGVGTGAAAVFSMAARFDAEMLFDLNGMQLTQVSFIPNEVLSTYKVMIYDAAGVPVDSTDALNGADLVMGEWVDVELPNPVNIVWTEDLIFGVKMVAETGYPGGIDNGPANVGMGDLIDLGAGWGSMFELYALDFNWALEGYADYASVEGLSIAPTDLPLEVSEAISAIQVESRLLTEPVQTEHANISSNRELLGYNVYRNDEQIATNILPVFTVFVDDWVPFGDHHYYLTALYNNTEDCGESENSDTAMVTLVNTPPGAVDLLTPADGSTVVVTPDNMDEEIQFFWTQAADADNDVVHYHMHAMGHFEGDTLMEMEAPMMAQANPSFEDNADTDTPLAPWGTWPPENTNFSFETEGNGIYNSDQTLMVYDGMHCLKVYGQYGETMPNVTPIYQGHSVEALGLQAGDAVAIEGQMMSHADDWVGQGANRAYLFLSFFDADWNFLGSSLSNMMDKTMPASEWHQFFALAVVPEGAVNMNAGVEYHQESGGDHGSVYFDDVNMFIPVTESILRVSHSDLVMAAMQDSVHHLTVEWDVAAMDVWDMTPSNNGPFTLTLDLSATLGIDESTLPDVFALYNNYPNPFNPVTNITYDIPEVSNVTLEIYNVMGQKVRTLVAGSHEPGRYRVLWNATNDFGEGLSSGMYIYKIQAGDFVNVKKLILMK